MEASGDRPEVSGLFYERLKSVQPIAGARLRIHHCVGYKVDEDAKCVRGFDVKTSVLEQARDLFSKVPPRPVVAQVPRVGRGAVEDFGPGKVAGDRPGQHRCEPAGNHDTGETTRTKRPRHRGQRFRGIIDDLEYSVAQHEVGRTRFNMLGQVCGIALDTNNSFAHIAFHRAPMERSKRIGARVDDPHAVTGFGEPDRRATCATTKINNAEYGIRAAGSIDRVDDCLPHDLRPDRTHAGNCATPR